MRLLVMVFLVGAVVAVLAACGPERRSNPSAADTVRSDPVCSANAARDVAYRRIPGVDPARLSLDVSPVPGVCDAPVVVWVHGGGWRIGDKSNGHRARERFYAAQGWVLVSVNYRLSTPDADPPVQYPDHNEDVAAALAWVHDHIAEHGGDPNRVLLLGHSAGAGIAAAITAETRYLAAHDLDPSWLRCVVLLDSAGYDVTREASLGRAGGIYRTAFGDDPTVWADASPTKHVGDGPLPGRVLVVTRGRPARVALATSFADQLRAAGVDVQLFEAKGLTHMQVNRRIGTGDDVMTPLMIDELDRCAAPVS